MQALEKWSFESTVQTGTNEGLLRFLRTERPVQDQRSEFVQAPNLGLADDERRAVAYYSSPNPPAAKATLFNQANSPQPSNRTIKFIDTEEPRDVPW